MLNPIFSNPIFSSFLSHFISTNQQVAQQAPQVSQAPQEQNTYIPGPGDTTSLPFPGGHQEAQKAINDRREAIFKGIQDGSLNKLEAYKLLKELDGISNANTILRTGDKFLPGLRDKLEAIDGKIARYRKGNYKPEAKELTGETGQMFAENFNELYNGVRKGQVTNLELAGNFRELNKVNSDEHFAQKYENGEWVDLTKEELEDKITKHLEKNYGHIEKTLANNQVNEEQETAYEDGKIKLDQYDSLIASQGASGGLGGVGGLDSSIAAMMAQMQAMMAMMYGGMNFGSLFGGSSVGSGLNNLVQSMQNSVSSISQDYQANTDTRENDEDSAEETETE